MHEIKLNDMTLNKGSLTFDNFFIWPRNQTGSECEIQPSIDILHNRSELIHNMFCCFVSW